MDTNEVKMLEPKLFAFELTETCKKAINKRKMANNTSEIEILEELLFSFNKISDKLSEFFDDTERIKLPEEEVDETINNIVYFKNPNDTKK